MESLFPYLNPHWREVIRETGFRLSGSVAHSYPPGAPTSIDKDSAGDGHRSAATFQAVRDDVLTKRQLDHAILNCYSGVDALRNPDFAAVLASAVNDWQISEWLEKDERLRGSLVVTPHDPRAAATEIDRLGPDPRFVQVLLPVRSQIPYGNRTYAPLFEAAERHDLVVGLHFGGTPGTPPTQSGWPTYYIEEYVGMAQVCQSQVISLIAEGVFDRYPDSRIALIECGFTWIPSLMWRLDKDWKGLRREIPWVRRPPSEYIRTYMRATVQPVDAPDDPHQLLEVVEQIGSDEFLLYSSDYPHAHSDEEIDVLVSNLPQDVRRGVIADNARSFYRLGPSDDGDGQG